jgi:drug/metabolite transporter (DMT)-like permease
LILLSAIWGSSFIFIKLSVETIDPKLLTFYRLTIASLALVVFCNKKNIYNCLKKNKLQIFIIAFLGNVIPFNLISYSEIYVDSVIASTLIGTMPIFTFLFSIYIFKKIKFTYLRFIGLLIGFLGMAIFIGPSNFQLGEDKIIFYLLIIISSICYAFSANVVKRVRESSPSDVAITSTVLAAIICLVHVSFEFILLENSEINNLSLVSVKSFVSATILGLVCTAFAIFIFFSLINKESAVFASQSNYLIPCFGSLWGILFLNEIVTSNMFIGLLLIVFSGWLVNKKNFKFLL